MKPALEFYVEANTYQAFGGHPTLSLIPDFLLTDAPLFGPAISELTVTFLFPSSGPPAKNFDELYADFHARRLELPKVYFRRSRGQANIYVASELIDGCDWENRRCLSVSLFRDGVGETIAALTLLKTRLTAKDDFDLEAFLAHCHQREADLPETEEALSLLKEELRKREVARRETMSPWERLGLDWRDFHPKAREILDDPFYWEQADDFSPHGNDTGADLLSDYRRWLGRHRSDDPVDFYHELMARWDFSADAAESYIRAARDEAAVALAFAELKLRGSCRPSAIVLAREAVQRQRQQALVARDWPHREERLRSLDLIEAKLRQLLPRDGDSTGGN